MVGLQQNFICKNELASVVVDVYDPEESLAP